MHGLIQDDRYYNQLILYSQFCSRLRVLDLSALTMICSDNSDNSNMSQQVAQLSQRDRAAGWVSFGQKWKTIFCRQYIFNHCDVIGLPSYRIR